MKIKSQSITLFPKCWGFCDFKTKVIHSSWVLANTRLHIFLSAVTVLFVAPQNSEVESFQSKLTPLNSTTLEKLRHILDHRCIVGGGEQIFLLSLGVSHQEAQKTKLSSSACIFFFQGFPYLKWIRGSYSICVITHSNVFSVTAHVLFFYISMQRCDLFKKHVIEGFYILVLSIPPWRAEVSDIHVGWEDASALEETGKLQARAAERHTSKCGDCPRAERRGERGTDDVISELESRKL